MTPTRTAPRTRTPTPTTPRAPEARGTVSARRTGGQAPDAPGTEASGVVPVEKPPGWTSHDVVGRVRRLAGPRKVGHAGT
ncbi:hypothetical protein R0J91_19200, partial [Micrococcus sp. SIMBA_131]